MGQYQTRTAKTSDSEEPVVRDGDNFVARETTVDHPLKDERVIPVFGSPMDSECVFILPVVRIVADAPRVVSTLLKYEGLHCIVSLRNR